MELHGYKSADARDMARKAGHADHIDFTVGDAVEMIGGLGSLSISSSSTCGRMFTCRA